MMLSLSGGNFDFEGRFKLKILERNLFKQLLKKKKKLSQ